MKFFSKVKQVVKQIGKHVKKSVKKAMSRVRPPGQNPGRQQGRGGPSGRRGGGSGSRGGGRMEDLSKSLGSLQFSVDDEGQKAVHIVTNYFPVYCSPPDSSKGGSDATRKEFAIHQFRCEFENKDMPILLRKNILKACQATVFQGHYIYDGGEQLYCTNLFQAAELVLRPELETKTSREAQGQAAEFDKQKLVFTYTKTLAQSDEMCLHIYNLIIRQSMFALNLVPIGDNFFDPDAAKIFQDLNIELWPGYIANVKPCEKGLFLCVDITHKVIHTQNLLTVINILKNAHTKKRSTKELGEFISDELKGCSVITPYNKKCYRIDGVLMNKTPMSTFQRDDKEITFLEYYRNKYNIDIVSRDQPLILSNVKQTFKGKKTIQEVILIPEILALTGLSDEMRSNMSLMNKLGKYLHMSPAERADMSQKFINRLTSSQEACQILEKWGLTFEPKLSPCFPATVLPTEPIIFADDNAFRPDDKNDWTRALRENKMLVSIPLKRWIVVTGERDEQLTNEFINAMIKVAYPLGFQILRPFIIEKLRDVRTSSYIRQLEHLTNTQKNLQLILCVLPNNGSELYNGIKKRLTSDIGIPSQCIVAKTMTKNMLSVATKVVIQINTKLGGEPWKVNLPPEFQNKSLTIGFDYSGKRIKTGVLVGTINADYTRYFSLTFQYGDASDFKAKLNFNIIKCVQVYQSTNEGQSPSRVVFYRNNVDDGKITSGEIAADATALFDGLKSFWTDQNLAEKPNLVYITVGKRSSTRLMSHLGKCDGKVNVPLNALVNPPPGTVVDKHIVSKEGKYDEFFMVPTVARQGSVRAIHYRVIMNTCEILPAILEAFTYKLCHLYYNWTGTVNLPSVIQYAGKMSKQVAQAIPNGQLHPNMAVLLHFL